MTTTNTHLIATLAPTVACLNCGQDTVPFTGDLCPLDDPIAREAPSLVDPAFEGMAWEAIVAVLDEHASEERAYWENEARLREDFERDLLRQQRYDEYWR